MEAHLVPPHEGVIEMTDELLPLEGISRRDLLKRSAIVGGASALVWAAPSITTLGNRAFGATGSPPNTGWSNVAFVVTCGGYDYRVKWNRDGKDAGFEQGELAPQCDDTTFKPIYDAAADGRSHERGWEPLHGQPPGGHGENTLVFTITRVESSDCAIRSNASTAVVKDANFCIDAGFVSEGGLKITFNL
jgi:hypothetical protein